MGGGQSSPLVRTRGGLGCMHPADFENRLCSPPALPVPAQGGRLAPHAQRGRRRPAQKEVLL